MAKAKLKDPPIEAGEAPPEDVSTPQTVEIAAPTLPTPPRFEMTPQEFFEYWTSIPPEVRNSQVIVYPYRVLPVCDNTQGLSREDLEDIRRKHKKKPETNLGKMVDPISPDGWAQSLAEWKGAGDYHFKLNNIHPSVKKTICMTTTSGEGPLRDWDSYPPVLELGHVVLTENRNQPYIRWAHLNGIRFPGEPGIDISRTSEENQQDMAATVAVEKLADALVKQSESKAPDNTAANMLSDLLRQSEARHLKELELQEARHVRDLEAITKRLEAAEKTAGAAPTTTQQVIEMARAITPPPAPPAPAPADNRMADVLLAMLQAEKTARIEELKLLDARHARETQALTDRLVAMDARETARIQRLEAAPPAAASGDQTANTFKVVLGAFEGFNKLKERIVGDADTGGTGNPWVDLAAELGPKLLDTISTVTTAVRNTPAAPQQQQGPHVPGVPQIQQQPTALTAEEQMIERIKAQLLQALTQNMHGSMFGGGIMFEYGETVYQYLANLGDNGLMAMLQRDGAYWGQIQQVASRVNIPQFIADFLNGPQVIERFQAIRTGQGQRPTGTPQQVPPPAQQQARPNVVDSLPASQAPQTGGRTIIREGGPVKVNGPIVEPPPA